MEDPDWLKRMIFENRIPVSTDERETPEQNMLEFCTIRTFIGRLGHV